MTDTGDLVKEALAKRIDYLNNHLEEAQHLENIAKYDAAQFMRKVGEGQSRTAALYANKYFKG